MLALQMAGAPVLEDSKGKDWRWGYYFFNTNLSLLWNGLWTPPKCACWTGLAWVAQGHHMAGTNGPFE